MSNSSLEINNLVSRYREGDSSAAEELLKRYEWYLKKWLRLLSDGRWDRRDKEVCHFLSMVGSVDISTSAQILHKGLRPYEKDDLLQEVRVAFLDTARRADNIVSQFRFVLWRRIKYLLEDITVSHRDYAVELSDANVAIEDAPELDSAWVEGITCGAGFDEMSPQERLILLFTKWYGFSIDKTAVMLGVSPATIDRAIRRAKVILKVHYLEKS